MKHTTLMTLILLVMHQTHASKDIFTLDPLKIMVEQNKKDSTIVKKERIETANTIGDALKDVSGVQSTSFGPNAGAPMIRSLAGNRVNILENGQAINGVNAISGNINIPFDPLFTRSITVPL